MFFEKEGNQIYYNVLGEGEPLILVHDGFYSSRSWDGIIDVLQAKYKVIIYDRLGYGKSWNENAFNYDLIEHGVEELLSLVHHLQLDKFHICGHCAGGAIALSFAAKYPECIKSIIAESVGLYTDKKILLKCNFVFRPLFQELSTDRKASLVKMHDNGKEELFWNKSRLYKSSYVMCKSYDIRQSISAIKKPILWIYGDRDFYFDLSHIQTAFSLVKNSFLWIAPNTNHEPHIEKKEHFTDTLIDFLK